MTESKAELNGVLADAVTSGVIRETNDGKPA